MFTKAIEVLSETGKVVYYIFGEGLQVVSLIDTEPSVLLRCSSQEARSFLELSWAGSQRIQRLVCDHIESDLSVLFREGKPRILRRLPAFLFQNKRQLERAFTGFSKLQRAEIKAMQQEGYSQLEQKAYSLHLRTYCEDLIKSKLNCLFDLDPEAGCRWVLVASEISRQHFAQDNHTRVLTLDLAQRLQARIGDEEVLIQPVPFIRAHKEKDDEIRKIFTPLLQD